MRYSAERMLSQDTSRAVANELIAVGQFFHQRGWTGATSGNYSARVEEGIVITASGVHKGELTPRDFLHIDLDRNIIESQFPTQRASAETQLHTSLYAVDDTIGAVLHYHSVMSTVASRMYPNGLELTGFEMLKAFRGVDTHEATVIVPVFANHQDMAYLSAVVEEHRKTRGLSFAYLIASHGVYTWGSDISEARRHAEGLEFVLECMITERKATRS